MSANSSYFKVLENALFYSPWKAIYSEMFKIKITNKKTTVMIIVKISRKLKLYLVIILIILIN